MHIIETMQSVLISIFFYLFVLSFLNFDRLSLSLSLHHLPLHWPVIFLAEDHKFHDLHNFVWVKTIYDMHF